MVAFEGSVAVDPIQGVQTEALHCVSHLGARNGPAALALCKSGVIDNIVVSQTHHNPRIKVRKPCLPSWQFLVR